MTKIIDVIRHLETIAPPALQESYDNSGLLCGDKNAEVKGVIVSLDALEIVVDEAIVAGCNLIVSHHPIVFSGLKSLTGQNYIERTVIKAIKHDIALYAIHTNLDNVLRQGVNEKIADVLGLTALSPLKPETGWIRHIIKSSELLKTDVLKALQTSLKEVLNRFEAKVSDESTIEVLAPEFASSIVYSVVGKYPVEIVSHAVQSNSKTHIGAGILCQTNLPMPEIDFLSMVAERLQAPVVRHTKLLGRSIQKVAICGGSGSFLLPRALRAGADIFITADYKYHQFFDAEDQIVIADVGHYESEQYTIDLLVDLINSKFTKFAARFTKHRTNPVHYFIQSDKK